MKLFYLALVTLLVSGCTTNHHSQALLFELKGKPDTTGSETYTFNGTGNNPIYVDPDLAFRIEIDQIRPGWIHFDTERSPLVEQGRRRLSRDAIEHILGKELWLISKVESLSTEDVLERNGKLYHKATNVKLHSDSFSELALDETEKNVFTHKADTPYRVSFRLYEVDGFALKKAFAGVYQNDPGITGVLKTGADLLTSTAGSLMGPLFSDFLKIKKQDELAFEKLLLELGATVELSGEVLILRKAKMLEGEPKIEKKYILYDAFKSSQNKAIAGFETEENYTNLRNALRQDVVLSSECAPNSKIIKGCSDAYIKLKVTQYYPPDSKAAKQFAKAEWTKKGKDDVVAQLSSKLKAGTSVDELSKWVDSMKPDKPSEGSDKSGDQDITTSNDADQLRWTDQGISQSLEFLEWEYD